MRPLITLLNIGNVVLVWFAVNGSVGATRLLVALAIVLAFFSLIGWIVIATDSVTAPKKLSNPFHRAVSYLTDLACTCLLIWSGWFWIGAVFAFQWFTTCALLSEMEKKMEGAK